MEGRAVHSGEEGPEAGLKDPEVDGMDQLGIKTH